jgi:hypothetical protein
MRGIEDFCFPAFLLGVWHYVVTKRGGKNTLGEYTVERWCPTEGNRKERKYSGDMGIGITRKITIRGIADALLDEEKIGDADMGKGVALRPNDILPDADPKRITVNNYGTVQNQKFVSIASVNGDIHL